ncbi:MAG: hypothetical protein P4L61_04145 [Candidatus Pacebacteria bacterium]|nr:hypothetical protein [Candidatus Paceibacterota bacterium]
MIQVEKNEIMRGGIKIGYIQGDHIFDRNNKKLANFSDKEAFDESGTKIARIDGEYVYFLKSNMKVRLEDNNKLVAGIVSDACRAAIRLMLG